MFRFSRKEKTKTDDKKKERKDSKKEKKLKDAGPNGEAEVERYTPINFSPPSQPVQTSSAGSSLKASSSKPLTPRGILKFRSSSKSKSSGSNVGGNADSSVHVSTRENTRLNEEMGWRLPTDRPPSGGRDMRKRESIHSITMNIAPPSAPPPESPTEKVYSANLELPSVQPMEPRDTRELSIYRQPSGDFGFNLRWLPFTDSGSSLSRIAVFAEPGASGNKSGVMPGDRILEINGVNVEDSSKEEVVSLVHRSANPLKLTVQQLAELSELNRNAVASSNKTASLSRHHGNVSVEIRCSDACISMSVNQPSDE